MRSTNHSPTCHHFQTTTNETLINFWIQTATITHRSELGNSAIRGNSRRLSNSNRNQTEPAASVRRRTSPTLQRWRRPTSSPSKRPPSMTSKGNSHNTNSIYRMSVTCQAVLTATDIFDLWVATIKLYRIQTCSRSLDRINKLLPILGQATVRSISLRRTTRRSSKSHKLQTRRQRKTLHAMALRRTSTKGRLPRHKSSRLQSRTWTAYLLLPVQTTPTPRESWRFQRRMPPKTSHPLQRETPARKHLWYTTRRWESSQPEWNSQVSNSSWISIRWWCLHRSNSQFNTSAAKLQLASRRRRKRRRTNHSRRSG